MGWLGRNNKKAVGFSIGAFEEAAWRDLSGEGGPKDTSPQRLEDRARERWDRWRPPRHWEVPSSAQFRWPPAPAQARWVGAKGGVKADARRPPRMTSVVLSALSPKPREVKPVLKRNHFRREPTGTASAHVVPGVSEDGP